MTNFKSLKQFLEMETDVVPAPATVQKDIAQDIAKMLFADAEGQAADIAADQNGHGFSGDAIKAHAEKTLQRVKMYLDDLIKQG
jgi:hypothetical protein